MPAKRPPNTRIALPNGDTIDFYDSIGVDGLPQQRRYMHEGEKLVGVSTVSNIFDKPALPWWGMECGIQAVAHLAANGVNVGVIPYSELLAQVKEHGLTCNDVRDSAAERGTAAHDTLVRLIADGKIPNPADHPPAQRPFIAAGAAWFAETRPEIIDAETIVASVELGVAGRYDLHARFPDGRTGRIDFKTSDRPIHDAKGKCLPPYPEHMSQVAGYELLAVSCGYAASNFQAIVRLDSRGRFDMSESWATPDHFLGDLAAYRNRASLRAGKRPAGQLQGVA